MSILHKITKTIALGITVILAACGDNEHKSLDIASMVEYMPIQTQLDGRWGLMSTDGTLLFEDEFTQCPTLTVNGMFSVDEDGTLSVYTPGEQPRLLGVCEGLSDVGFANEGRIPMVKSAGRIFVADNQGERLFTLDPVNGSEITQSARFYNDGRLIITDDRGLYGSVDIDGQVVIAPKYDLLTNYNEGVAIARLAQSGRGNNADKTRSRTDSIGQYVVIDPDDQKVFDVKKGYNVVSPMVKGGEFVATDSAGMLCIMDLKGQIQHLPAKVKEVGTYTDALLTFRDAAGYWGVMSRQEGNAVMIRPKFSSLTLLEGADQLLVDLDGRWEVIGINGKRLITMDDSYQSVVYTPYGGRVRYMAQDHAGWLMLDADGHEIAADFSIYGFGNKPTLEAGPINSHMFDLMAFEKNVLSLITENSLADIRLNTIANPWYSDQNPEDFVDKSEFSPSVQPQSDYGYEINVVGVTDRMITMSRYSYADGEFRPVFVPNNTVYAIELIIPTTVKDIYSKSLDTMVKALEEMGYTVVERETDSVTLRSKYANIELSPLENEEGLSVLMYKL